MKTFFLILISAGIISSQNLTNLDDAKAAVKEYYESGRYGDEVKQILEDVEKKIEELQLPDSSLVIFDVDDTALSGYEYTKEIGFGFRYDTWKEYLLKSRQKSVPHMQEFYSFLRNRGISVIFLTGRSEILHDATKLNLARNGFLNYDTLICRDSFENKLPAAKYKEIKRKELAKKGYKIIASIGDQLSDLRGDNTGLKIKLPNYLYKID
jgi:acid phosphatase